MENISLRTASKTDYESELRVASQLQLNPELSQQICPFCGSSKTKVFRDRGEEENVSLDTVPQDVLRKICLFLPRDSSFFALKCTCRRLHRFLDRSDYWITDTLRMSPTIHVKAISRLLELNPRLVTLDISGCLAATDDFLQQVAAKCPFIRKVDLSSCALVTGEGLVGLCKRLTRLVHLCIADTKRISCESVAQVMRLHSASISSLDLSRAAGLCRDAHMLSFLMQHKLKLRTFVFRWDRNVTSSPSSVQHSISTFLQACPHLRSLCLVNLQLREYVRTLEIITGCCPNLTCLVLRDCCVNDTSMNAICRRLHSLRFLDIGGSDNVSDLTLEAVGGGLRHLSFLGLSGCINITDRGLTKVLQRSPYLRDLTLRGCHQITDSSLRHIYRVCPRLMFVDVSETMISMAVLQDLQSRTQPEITVLAEQCPHVAGVDYRWWKRMPRHLLNAQDRLQMEMDELFHQHVF